MGTASAYVASAQVDDPNTAAPNTGDLTATRYYTFGGSTVAIRTNDGNLSLMMGDEQGSTHVVMPVTVVADGNGTTAHLAPATLADASAITRTSYTPYGELRGADNTATDRGWLGQVEDRVDGATGTGLTYLNARYYDPTTMRFVSPDPLLDPGDPNTLDPYRYADNNPVVFTDATGLWPSWGELPGFWADMRRGGAAAEMNLVVSSVAMSGGGYLMSRVPGLGDPLDDVYSGIHEGTVADGYAVEANRMFNPVYQMLESGSCAWDSASAGNGYGTGYCGESLAVSTASTVLVATGGVEFVSTRIPTGATRIAPEVATLAPEAAAPRPPVGQAVKNWAARIRTANPGADTVVIGRQMDAWVKPMASHYGAGYYKGTPALLRNMLSKTPALQDAVDLAFNKAWIRAQKAARKTILDLGQRDAGSKLPRSVFYEDEQRATRNYPGYVSYK